MDEKALDLDKAYVNLHRLNQMQHEIKFLRAIVWSACKTDGVRVPVADIAYWGGNKKAPLLTDFDPVAKEWVIRRGVQG